MSLGIVRNKKNYKPDIIVVAVLSTLIFWFMIAVVLNSDIQWHAELLYIYHRGENSFPPNFLYYLLLELFSFFSGDMNLILFASGLILSIALTAKYIISKRIIIEFIEIKGLIISEKQKKIIPVFLAGSLLFLFAIPDYYNLFILHKYYLGRMVPNIWHNSTTITVFPFALWLFWEQYKLLIMKEEASFKKLFFLSLLVLLNCLIKPSFIFVYVPVSGLFLLLKFGYKAFPTLVKYSIPLVLGLFLIFFLQFLIFQLQLGAYQDTESKVILLPAFKAWEYLIPLWYIPYSLILSYSFPLLFLLLFPRFCAKNTLMMYVLMLLASGLLISIFIGEDGARAHHGNFFWQNFICCYLWMMCSALGLLEKWAKNETANWKMILLMGLYICHFLAGIGYFIKMGLSGSYY